MAAIGLKMWQKDFSVEWFQIVSMEFHLVWEQQFLYGNPAMLFSCYIIEKKFLFFSQHFI